jgi:hypothetical protein
MISSPTPDSLIQQNPDGSLDAICFTCFVTAGTAMSESGLSAIEQAHQCDIGLLVARYQWAKSRLPPDSEPAF